MIGEAPNTNGSRKRKAETKAKMIFISTVRKENIHDRHSGDLTCNDLTIDMQL